MKLIRDLSEDEIRDIAEDFKDGYWHGGIYWDTFDSIAFAKALFEAAWIKQQDETL